MVFRYIFIEKVTKMFRPYINPSITVCLTFGESKIKHVENKMLRQWYLGGKTLDEVSHVMYLGNKLCAYNDSTDRSKYMSK